MAAKLLSSDGFRNPKSSIPIRQTLPGCCASAVDANTIAVDPSPAMILRRVCIFLPFFNAALLLVQRGVIVLYEACFCLVMFLDRVTLCRILGPIVLGCNGLGYGEQKTLDGMQTNNAEATLEFCW